MLRMMTLLSLVTSTLLVSACTPKGDWPKTKTSGSVAKSPGHAKKATGTTMRLFIGPERALCAAANGYRECVLMRTSSDEKWAFLFDGVKGFTPEVGTRYELLVTKKEVPHPEQDDSSVHYVLEKIVSKASALDTAKLPAACKGKKLVIKPEVTTEGSDKRVTRVFKLKMTFCDGSTAIHIVDQSPSPWVFPWWSKTNFDPGGSKAGASLSVRGSTRDKMQKVIRVVPKEGYLSLRRAVRPLAVKPGGLTGQGELIFDEFKRLALPEGAVIEVDKK